MKVAKRAVKPAALAPMGAPAAPSAAVTPRASVALNPAAAWPFPTGSRP
jgi:hypothetical protein